jgi:capsular polysaccharide biosynthesis protein
MVIVLCKNKNILYLQRFQKLYITMNQASPKEDFDLIDVAVSAYRLFKRYYRIFIFFPVAGALLALLLSFVLIKPVYQNSFIVYFRVLNPDEALQLIKDLETLKEDNYPEDLAKVLGIGEAQARSLKSITARRVEGKNNQLSPMVIVEFETTKPEDYEAIQNALVNYLSGIPYVEKENNLFLKRQKALLAEIQSQIQRLDSMHVALVGTINNLKDNQQLLINSIYTEIIQLKEKQLAIERELQYPEAVRIVEPVRPLSKPAKASPKTNVLIGFFVGFFLAIAYAFFLEVKRRAAQAV